MTGDHRALDPAPDHERTAREVVPPLSRRHLLAAAAGAGAVVAVVGAAGSAAAGAFAGTANSTAAGAREGTASAPGPVVVHLRDLASGSLDVFSGTERREVRDRALAERIARAAGSPQPTSL